MAKVLLLSLASALVTAQHPQFLQQSDFSQQARFNSPIPSIDPTISFNYGYEVDDKNTGDAKTHQEALENGVLRGSYSVVQPDGNKRIVEYEADEVSGFQAKVRYESGYPIQTPPQRRPSTGVAGSSQGTRFSSGSSSSSSSSSGSSSSGSSSSGSSSRGSRPNRPLQGTRFPGTHQGSSFTGGISAQQSRFPAGTSQGPRFGPPGPTSQVAPSRFIGGPPSQTSQFQGSSTSSQSSGHGSSSSFSGSVSQNRLSSAAGVSASQGSQFRPAGFPGNPTGSSTIDASRPAGHLPAGITSSRRPQIGTHGSRFSSGSSQSASVSSQNKFASSSSQTGQASPVFSGPGHLPQRISTGSRLQVGPPPSVHRPVSPGSPRPGASVIRRPGAPFPSQPNAQADVAVQIAPNGFFSQRGSSSSSTSSAQSGASLAGISGAAFGAGSRAGISGASFSGASQSDFSGAAFQQDRSSHRFQSGAPSVSIQSSNAFQSGQGSRFQGGPGFDQLISSSLLVTDENLDSIDAVELASAGFDDSSYAYRLVPVPVNN